MERKSAWDKVSDKKIVFKFCDDYIKYLNEGKTERLCVEYSKKLAEENGFTLHKFNKNHYEFSAVLKHEETGKFIYVSISDVRFFPDQWYDRVLIRTMSHDKDWTGGQNNRCYWEDIGTTAKRLVERGW